MLSSEGVIGSMQLGKLCKRVPDLQRFCFGQWNGFVLRAVNNQLRHLYLLHRRLDVELLFIRIKVVADLDVDRQHLPRSCVQHLSNAFAFPLFYFRRIHTSFKIADGAPGGHCFHAYILRCFQ